MLSGRGLCDELIIRPEESYRLCCVVVCDLETSRMGAPYIYDISRLRVKAVSSLCTCIIHEVSYFNTNRFTAVSATSCRINTPLLFVCSEIRLAFCMTFMRYNILIGLALIKQP